MKKSDSDKTGRGAALGENYSDNVKLMTGLLRSEQSFDTPAIVAIARTTMSILDDVPPAIAADIYDYGMMLTGGCALMPGMPAALARETGLRVTVAEHPRDAVIHGLGRILRQPTLWGTPLEYRLK